MFRANLALIAALAAASLAPSRPADAQSMKLQYGMPLGSFTATPSGHPTQTRSSKEAYAKPAYTEKQKRTLAAARSITAKEVRPAKVSQAEPSNSNPDVRDDAARQAASTPPPASNEPQNVETKTEAAVATTVASGENRTCRKFIATAGTTIEVPCASASE